MTRRGGAVLAAAFFAIAAVGVHLPASAAAIPSGRVWLLLTSALQAQGPLPLAQVATAAAGAHAAAAEPDYGVSCVLGASCGALLATRGGRVVEAAGTLALVPLSLSWLGLEHPLSIALGFAVTAWRRA
jgi:hypothetical protein